MNVTLRIIILVGLSLSAARGSAAEIERCLSEASRRTHVIDQEQAIEGCFQSQAKQLSQNKCYEAVLKITALKKQLNMSESLNSICFYQTTDFIDLKSCMIKAELFKIADNHDEAIFDCYKQFQNALTQKQCIQISRKMIYPAKKDYLFDHCQNNP